MKPDKLTGKQAAKQTDRQTDHAIGLTKYFDCGHVTPFPVGLTTDSSDRPQEYCFTLFHLAWLAWDHT